MKEKFERFKNEKIVVNVRSQKQYDEFMKLCEEQGLKWSTGNLAIEKNIYNMYTNYKEETCINLNNLKVLSFCDINFYKNKCYKIITYKDFIKEESSQFTISGLKDNHIIKARNGNKYIWFNYQMKNRLREDLRDSYWDNDIIEVYEFETLVWKREEKPVEILDEVEKKWLKNFIKSTEIKVNYIRKINSCKPSVQYLYINAYGDGYTLPYFKKNTMYQGMEANKGYTLKELGLDK